MIAPNTGSLIMPSESGGDPTAIDGALGSRSSIIDYKGTILSRTDTVGDAYTASEINIEALRHYRQNIRFQNGFHILKLKFLRSSMTSLYGQAIFRL